jgi:hypothetical protein
MVKDTLTDIIAKIHAVVNEDGGIKALLAEPLSDGDADKADSPAGNNKATTRISQHLLTAKEQLQELASECTQARKQVIAWGHAKKDSRKAAKVTAQAAVPPPPTE